MPLKCWALQSISPEIQIDIETLTKTIESVLGKIQENEGATLIEGANIKKEEILIMTIAKDVEYAQKYAHLMQLK